MNRQHPLIAQHIQSTTASIQSIQSTDAPLRVSNKNKKMKKSAKRYRLVFSFWSNKMNWFWCRFYLIQSPTTRTNRTCTIQRRWWHIWLCSLAEHLKLGSNPSSQSLQQEGMLYFTYFCLLYTHIYHTDACIVRIWASYHSQTKCLLVDDLGCNTHRKKEKVKGKWADKLKQREVVWILYDFRLPLPMKHYNLRLVRILRGCSEQQERKKGKKWRSWPQPNGFEYLSRMYLFNVIFFICYFCILVSWIMKLWKWASPHVRTALFLPFSAAA